MTREIIFSILGFSIALLSNFFYVKGIYKGTIIPHPFTMFIWIVVQGISVIELIARHEPLGSLPIFVPIFVCIYGLIIGISKWSLIQTNMFDWFFFFSGIALMLFWQLEPNYAYVIWVMIAIDAFAYASSFKKAWLQPFTENALPYFISVGNNIATILAITVWNFENLGMWIWTAGVNFTFACFILLRQYSLKKK